jgi:hypothetical protein
MQRIRVDLDKVCETPAKLAKHGTWSQLGAGMGSEIAHRFVQFSLPRISHCRRMRSCMIPSSAKRLTMQRLQVFLSHVSYVAPTYHIATFSSHPAPQALSALKPP